MLLHLTSFYFRGCARRWIREWFGGCARRQIRKWIDGCARRQIREWFGGCARRQIREWIGSRGPDLQNIRNSLCFWTLLLLLGWGQWRAPPPATATRTATNPAPAVIPSVMWSATPGGIASTSHKLLRTLRTPGEQSTTWAATHPAGASRGLDRHVHGHQACTSNNCQRDVIRRGLPLTHKW